jgi:hypothetical protein
VEEIGQVLLNLVFLQFLRNRDVGKEKALPFAAEVGAPLPTNAAFDSHRSSKDVELQVGVDSAA